MKTRQKRASSRSTRSTTSTFPNPTTLGIRQKVRLERGLLSTASATVSRTRSLSTVGTTRSTSSTQFAVEKYSSSGSLLDEFGHGGSEWGALSEGGRRSRQCYDGIARRRASRSTNRPVTSTSPTGFAERIDISPERSSDDPRRCRHRPSGADPDLRASARHREPDGVATTDCKFEWGAGTAFEGEVPCDEGDMFGGSGSQHVSARNHRPRHRRHLPFPPRRRKRQRSSPTGWTGSSRHRENHSSARPIVNGLNTDAARLNAEIDPNHGPTSYHFEYGTDTTYGTVVPIGDDAVSPADCRR